jgi:outer membrane protein assembly factor BamB
VYASMAGNGGRVVAYRTSTASTLWSSRGDGDVQALALMGGTLYVGGHFSQFRGQNRVQAAALSPATGRLRGWRPAFRQPNNPGVWAITPGTDFVRVGGGFIHVGRADIRGYVEFRVG